MKKTRFLKVLAPIVALGLLIGALVGISASANEAAPASDVTPEIISMNVEYGSELYLYYAVDKASVSGTPALQVLSDAAGTSVIYTVTDYTEESVNGKDCYIFKTAGVSASDINKIQYVRAASDSSVGVVREASVEMYLYAKLYKEGFALKTASDGDDFIRRNLYFQLIKYAKFAQELFYFGENYEAIGSVGIIISGAKDLTTGKVASNSNYIKLNAAAVEGKTFSYWKVEDISTALGDAVEEKVRLYSDGYECIVNNSAKITPVYDAASMEGVEIWDSAVDHFNYLNKSINEVTSGWSSNKSKYEAAGKTLIGENKWGIVNEGDNNVLFIDKKCGGMVSYEKDGQTVTEMTEWNAGVYIASKPSEVQANATVAVFEFDVKMTNLGYNDAFVINLKNSQSKNIVNGYIKASNVNDGSKFAVYGYKNVDGADTGSKLGATNSAKLGDWFHVRVEYRVTATDEAGNVTGINVTWKYGDAEFSYTDATVAGMCKVNDLSYVSFGWNARNVGDYYVDNVSFKLLAE